MTKELYREQRGLPIVESCLRESRQAFHRLRRSPAFTAASVLSLALAIAANVAIFAVVERVVLHPLPYPDSGRIVMLDFGIPARNIPAGFANITTRQYFHYSREARTIESLAVYRAEDRTLTDRGTPERVHVARVTPSLAQVLRVAPQIGGWFADRGERGAPPAAVLSYGLWTRRYGADRAVVGRTITLDGVATPVVGVMPASFAFPDARVDAWVPEPFSGDVGDDAYTFTPVARLQPGATIEQARAELNQLSRALHASAPGNGYDADVSTAVTLQDWTVGPIAPALWTLLAAAGIVLLVACANIANLFLVRSEARQREIAVRRALGASTGNVAGYFLAESALLSFSGGALGLAVAWYGIGLLVAFGPANLPRINELALAPIHAVFVLGLTALVAVVFGAVPLVRLRTHGRTLSDGTRGATASRGTYRVRQALMAGQVALALVLLAASGLLFRSFVRLRAADPGFDATSALTFQIGLPKSRYPDRRAVASAHQAILDRLARLPGVTVASAVTCVPLSGRGFCGGAPFIVQGEPFTPGTIANRSIVAIRPVTGSYFEAMGMPLRRGRGITRRDVEDNELVAVVNDALARVAFPGQDPLGKRIALGPHAFAQLWFTVVGVVPTTPTISLTEPVRVPKMYVPMFAEPDVWPAVDLMTYVLRTATPPTALAPAARAAVKKIDPDLALARVRTLQDFLDAAAGPRAFTMILIVIAASAALLLGLVGIYGVMSYVVSQRTVEIGVLIALGAEPRAVMRMIVRQGGAVALCGIAVGLTATLAGGRFIASLLYQVSPRDPAVLGVTTATLLATALVACWIPARRAARVDPLIALRAD